MQIVLTDAEAWAQQTFGTAQLGDVRRTRRLVDLTERLASQPQASIAKACGPDPAASLGGYRLIENQHVDPAAMAEAGFAATAIQAQQAQRILALSDTTDLHYMHQVAEQLGDMGFGGPEIGGWHVHSTLLIDGTSHQMIGLIDQNWHSRDRSGRGRKLRRKKRTYRSKESFKWQANSQRMAQRLEPAVLSRVIEVGDAEADIYEYLDYKLQQHQRFIVRVAQDRALSDADQHLWAYLASQPQLGQWEVLVPQKGGRPSRLATVEVRAAWVTLRPPHRAKGRRLRPLSLWAVLVEEIDPPSQVEEPLCWRLYSSEPAEAFAPAQQVAQDYAQRPQVEVFHKAWKSGCRLEQRRQQTPENLQRMGQILAFIAVRLVQLSQGAQVQPTACCEPFLERTAWQCLWQSVQPKQPLPKKPPNCQWAIDALARLGGFQDTKRTGRAGWQTIWHGYWRLQERLIGYLLAQDHKM
jgi:hypothetical protein